MAIALLLAGGSEGLRAQDAEHGGRPPRQPIVLAEQGSFAFGGRVITDALDSTLHCDHGYTEFQTPQNARELPLIMWHSTSTKTWTSTPNGRRGFQDIFLRRGFGVHIVDLPRQGRASNGCVETIYTPNPGQDQTTFVNWRLGTWDLPGPPTFFPNSQTPRDTAFLNQVLRARYPDNEDFEDTDSTNAGAMAALLEKIGPATLITHSGSGRYGWLTAIESPKVRGIVSFEPSVYVFPPGELPPPNTRVTLEVPLADFQKLTRVPILIVFGDFLDQAQRWADALANGRAFAEAVNRHGGHAEVIVLPEVGLVGNSHIMMLERNNVEVADLVSRFLRENGLAKRAKAGDGRELATTLSGAEEVPPVDSTRATGTFVATINQEQGQLCYELEVDVDDMLGPVTAAHIHEAPPGVAGPVVVPLGTPTGGSSGSCIDVDRGLLRAIWQDPRAYYVNVHSEVVPSGEIRGQLSRK